MIFGVCQSSELEALVSHFGQALALTLGWTFGKKLGILYFNKLSNLLCLCWWLGSSVGGGEE